MTPITESLLDEAAVASVLILKDTKLTVNQLEQLAAVVKETLTVHLRWDMDEPNSNRS